MTEHTETALAADFAETHVGVIFALAIEAGSFEDRLAAKTLVRGAGFSAILGYLGQRKVVSLRAGVGAVLAAKGYAALTAGHCPSWIVSAGFSGGLDPRLNVGDLVLADRTIGADGRALAIDVHGTPPAPHGAQVLTGPIVQRESIIRLPSDKAALFQSTHALSVDMESFTIAELCAADGRKFLAARAISDAAGEELPSDVEKLIAPQTGAQRAGRILGGVFRRPSLVKDLWTLQGNASKASANLGEFLATMIAALP